MSTLLATDLKNGTTFELEGKPYKVASYAHQKIGRGGATVKVSARNLESGALEQKTFQSTNKLTHIDTSKRELQYLYNDGQDASFMDPVSFEQIQIPTNVLGEDLYYIKEGETINVLFWGERPLSVELSPKVTLTVKETVPGVKGNSATNIYKPATLENGLNIKIPLFIKEGDKIRVDTRTGEYVERAN